MIVVILEDVTPSVRFATMHYNDEDKVLPVKLLHHYATRQYFSKSCISDNSSR